MAISAAHGEKKKNEGVPSLSVDDAASTAEAAIAPGMFTNLWARVATDHTLIEILRCFQLKQSHLPTVRSKPRRWPELVFPRWPWRQRPECGLDSGGAGQGCGFGNWAECDGGTPTATAAPRLPCDDVKPSASTASRGGSGIVPSAAPVCGKSGKTGDVGELPGQDTKVGGLLQKTQG